jgi:undecaprenyl-phosphate 4-deoxy-4-formamido-L-arabinose transferase
MTSVSIVIPVYNAEGSLKELYNRLIPAMETATNQFEVIMVEDCGADNSWDIISKLAERDQRIRAIRLSRNYGQHNALLCGIRAARYSTIVTMDDDLQNPVSEIPVLLAKLAEGYDVVYGTPQKEQHGMLRNIASRITKLALKSAMGVDTAGNVSAFRAFRSRLREGFKEYRSPFVSIDVLLTWSTSSFAAVSVFHESRQQGKSNYTFSKLIRHALNLMTGFSTLPLQIASFTGFAFTFLGICLLIYVVSKYLLLGGSVPGFTFLASIIAIFSGVQLFTLGIFGEYLARIHFRTMDRPPYLVTFDSSSSHATNPIAINNKAEEYDGLS